MDLQGNSPSTFTDLSLEQLKIMFGDQISPRRLSSIVDKYDLIKLLWKEAKIDDLYLEKYKINNMNIISQRNDAFSRHLMTEVNLVSVGRNLYAQQRENEQIHRMPQRSVQANNNITNMLPMCSEEKQFKIHSLVRSDIGTKWREFGRHLRIKEGKLDSINLENHFVENKVDAIFQEFDRSRWNEFTYVEKICNALKESRRKDLSDAVIRIMQRS